MNRREFLRSAAVLGAASTILGREVSDAIAAADRGRIAGGSILERAGFSLETPPWS